MGIRDLLSNDTMGTPSIAKDPDWMKTDSLVKNKIFQAAKSELNRISELLLTGIALKAKDRRLCAGAIARIAGAHRSYVSIRRLPEFCDWIDRQNEMLAIMAQQHQSKLRKHLTKSKREMEVEISELKQLNKQNTETYLRNTVETIFLSDALEDRDSLARQNIRLRLENQQLSEKIGRLQSENRLQSVQVGRMMKILSPQQRAELSDLRTAK